MLIEDGILKGYMQDRQNARLMGVAATGNSRRQSYAAPVMPRMTNTYMLGGDKDPAEILGSVKKGIYASNFGGGQVDITNGKFVFSCTEAYIIEDGKLGHAIKGATLIGSGPESLTRVSMIGNDMKLDTGVGTCGKNGQSVPVGGGADLAAGRADGRRYGAGGLTSGNWVLIFKIVPRAEWEAQSGDYHGSAHDRADGFRISRRPRNCRRRCDFIMRARTI